MNAPAGSADFRPTESPSAAIPRRGADSYLRRRSERLAAQAVRRQTVYGLILGWVLAPAAGFVYFCVPSRMDWLWATLAVVGLVHLAAAVVLPQLLAWPERAWMALARLQGALVMGVLLTAIYYLMFWPVGALSRRRGTQPFFAWRGPPLAAPSGWEAIDLGGVESGEVARGRQRGLAVLLGVVVATFFRRGRYLVLPVLVLLLVLGLVLFFVQSTALAPFIYNLF